MLTAPLKVVLALVIVALICAGFYLLDWQSRFSELDQLQRTLTERHAKLDKTRQALQELPALTAQADKLEQELHSAVTAKLPDEPAQQMVANYLTDLERAVTADQETRPDPDFQIVSIAPGAASSSANSTDSKPVVDVPTRAFQMQLTGRFPTVVHFLDQLGAMELHRLVTINKLSLAPQGGNGPDSPVLSVTLPVTAYLKPKG